MCHPNNMMYLLTAYCGFFLISWFSAAGLGHPHPSNIKPTGMGVPLPVPKPLPDFWPVFSFEVSEKKSWKCYFPTGLMTDSISQDATLYEDDTLFRKRRQSVTEWMKDDNVWANIILGACKELFKEQDGEFVAKFRNLGLLEALKDFVEHINYFHQVASIMHSRGENVVVLSPNSSSIHDIDKLDPVMLVAYSERFEDNQSTSLWDVCVDRHTLKNPHHQAHCMWRECCRCGSSDTNSTKVCMGCESLRDVALREMICDKVSRRLQKNLKGQVSDAMWDTDMEFFKGLPDLWMEKAFQILQRLKKTIPTSNKAHPLVRHCFRKFFLHEFGF